MTTPKRLIFNISESLHQKVKIAAAKRNISITKYVLQAILWRMKNDEV